MTSPFAEDLKRLRTQYRKARSEFVETSQKIRSLTAAVTSPDGFVTVALGSQGELTELNFNFKNACGALAGQICKLLPPSPFPSVSITALA